MKKMYSKPDIMFENFSMSTNIASDCEETANVGQGQCGVSWMEGLYTLFTDTIDGCSKKTTDGSPDYNGLCYHNFSADNNVFSSK